MLTAIADTLHELYRTNERIIPEHYLITARDFTAYCQEHQHIDSSAQEMLIVESIGNDIAIGLYLDPRIVQQLVHDAPQRNLHAANFEATCLAIEGISHLLCVLWKASRNEAVTQLELELQAEIDKYLLCSQWLRSQGKDPSALLYKLFAHYELRGGMSAAAAQRYRTASTMAARYCHILQAQHLSPNRMHSLKDRLRAFYRQSHWQKLRRIQRLSAGKT